jgi:tetratricopeptide (TPR) repeat protein
MQFDGITELFRSQLAQSAHLNLVEPDDLLNALSEMGKRVDSPTSEDLQEASWRLNVPVAIFGTLTQVGPDYALSIQLETRGPEPQNPSSKTLKSFGASDPAGLMRSVRDASVWIRETLGESEESISAADRLPVNVTTPSWEALAFYARAERQAVNRKFEEALLMLDSALDRDGQFALAALRKADILMSLNRQLEGLIQWRKAIGLLDRRPITRREELHARGMYAFDTGDLSQAGRYFASWAVEYPNDYRGWFYQAVPLMLDGHAREAITSLERVVKMMPGFGSGYAQLVHTHNLLGERDQALQWVQRFRAVGPRERCDITEASIHFAASDYTRTIQLLQRARSSDNPYTRSLAIVSEAIVWIELGAYQRAAALIEGSFALMDSTKSQGQAADAQATLAWAFLLAGDKKRAAKAAAAALSIDSGPLALVQAATVCIRAGRPDLAAPAVERCREFSDMPCYQFAASRMAGETAALEGRSDEAISALRRAAGIEPKLAFRDYLAEVFPPGHSERLEIQNKIAGLAPLVLRVPLTQTPGSFGRTMMDLHKRSPDVRTAAHLNSVRSALAAFPNSPI